MKTIITINGKITIDEIFKTLTEATTNPDKASQRTIQTDDFKLTFTTELTEEEKAEKAAEEQRMKAYYENMPKPHIKKQDIN